MNNVLVTGGAGFIGGHLVKSLSSKGFKVIVVDIAEPSTKDTDDAKAVVYYRKDIRNTGALQAIIRRERVETCIHLAAKVGVADSVINPDDTLDTNVKGTMSVLEACSRNGVENFVFASSAAVYGEPLQLPIKEDHPLRPLSPYGRSKVAGEELVAAYNACGKIKNAVTLRFFNVYGENQNPAYTGVITKFAERLSKGLPPIIYGNGNQTRDFIHVSDVVKAIITVIESGRSGIYNIASGRAITINDLAAMMIHITNIKKRSIYCGKWKEDIIQSRAEVEKARTELGFVAATDLEEYLTEVETVRAMTREMITNL